MGTNKNTHQDAAQIANNPLLSEEVRIQPRVGYTLTPRVLFFNAACRVRIIFRGSPTPQPTTPHLTLHLATVIKLNTRSHHHRPNWEQGGSCSPTQFQMGHGNSANPLRFLMEGGGSEDCNQKTLVKYIRFHSLKSARTSPRNSKIFRGRNPTSGHHRIYRNTSVNLFLSLVRKLGDGRHYCCL